MLVISTMLFWLGIHIIDTVYNMEALMRYTGREIVDTTIIGKELKSGQAYMVGFRFLYISFFLFTITIFVLLARV